MNPVDKELNQQILFDDDLLSTDAKTNDKMPEQQVVLPETAWQPVEEFIEQPESITKSKPRWLWRIAGLAFTGVVVYELIDFFIEGFAKSPIITSVYAVLATSIGVIAGLTVSKELWSLRQFNRQQKQQAQAKALLTHQQSFDAKDFCQQISKQLPIDQINQDQERWLNSIESHHSEEDILQLYSQQVLTDVDKQALSSISKLSTEVVLLVAISPIAVVDMLILLWRNFRLIDKVAGLYGVRLGFWARIGLIKRVFRNMIFAGATEIIADVGVDLLGVDALGRLSTRAAQGLGAGMLTARLGLQTMSLCRPIPFIEQPPGISHVRRQVITQVKALLTSSHAGNADK
ncbi:YcjF family protein [Thalassotalea aquiviva]|uniref:YcjF family protein n=1 Tax=Thalassotalea aquiviva TaxID=3242415 RepID=UPI00352A2F1C